MEIAKINDLIEQRCYKKFSVIAVDKDFSSGIGDINIIRIPEKEKIIKAFISDLHTNNQTTNIPIYAKTLVTDENINARKTLIFEDIEEKKKYIALRVDETYSPVNDKAKNVIITIQDLDLYSKDKKINFIFTTKDAVEVSIKDNFLLQDIYKTKDNVVQKVELQNVNMIPMIVNPIAIDENSKFFFNTLNYFHLFNIKKFTIKKPESEIDKTTSDEQINRFLIGIEEIVANVSKMSSSFLGMTEEQIKEFKSKVYGGTNIRDYTDWALYDMLQKSNLTINEFEMYAVMCSSFLNSSYCFNGGMTEKHKWFLPFYFEYIRNRWYLCSTFYKFDLVGNKLEYKVANEFTNFNVKTIIDFPLIPKEIKEINYSLDWKNWESSGLHYKVNLLCGNNEAKIPFELVHNYKTINNNIRTITITAGRANITYEYLEDLIRIHEENDKLNIVDDYISVVRKQWIDGETADGFPLNVNPQTQFKKFVFINGGDYSDSGYKTETWTEVDEYQGQHERTRTTCVEYTFTVKIAEGSFNRYYSYRFDSSLKQETNFIQNKFILTYDSWLEFLKSYEKKYKNEPINLTAIRNEILTIKGIFLPRKLYIDDIETKIDISSNIGEININYLN